MAKLLQNREQNIEHVGIYIAEHRTQFPCIAGALEHPIAGVKHRSVWLGLYTFIIYFWVAGGGGGWRSGQLEPGPFRVFHTLPLPVSPLRPLESLSPLPTEAKINKNHQADKEAA